MIVVAIDGLARAFGGLRAVDGVSFDVARGELVGLIGPNGAGKTALVNLISGFYRPDSGSVRVMGREIAGRGLRQIAQAGVARTFQNLRLFGRMTVLENVLLAEPRTARAPWRAAVTPGGHGRGAAMALLDRMGLAGRANEAAGALSYGEARRLELARALATRPALLLLDEPAAGMNDEEKLALVRTIQSLRREVAAVLLVEHDMGMIRALADRVVAMETGRVVTIGSADAVLAHPAVVEAYLGAA